MSRLEELLNLAAQLGFSEDVAHEAHAALIEDPEWTHDARG